MQDLFKSKKEQVYDFIKSKGRVRTSEVIKFGSSIFSNRAEKDARDLGNSKYTNPVKIWRMRDDIKRAVYGDIKEDAWSTLEVDREYSLTPAPKDIGGKG